jgi:hypothetical protein
LDETERLKETPRKLKRGEIAIEDVDVDKTKAAAQEEL